MIKTSEEFKTLTKKIKKQDVKLIVDNKNIDYKELVYSFDGQLFKTIMKQIEITLKNANEIKDKDVNFQYGLNVNNQFEYINLGCYYIKDIEDSKKKDEITVTGYDKMLSFMKTFKQSELKITYPCTILQLVQKICEICGVELYDIAFFNADLIVEDDFFTAQELTYRDVLEKIAQATLTTVFIKEDKLYFCKVENNSVQKIDKSYLTDLIVKEKFGSVNALVLGRGDVEDNIEEVNAQSITENGRCEIRFDENEFIQYKREDVIKDMFNKIKGLEYYSFEGSDVGIMWLEPCDCIELGDREENFYKSYYLKANIRINTGISTDIEADIPEETNTEYKVTTKEEKKYLKVERLAKKNEGVIQDLIQENSEHEEKITEVLQTMDSITQKVENVADVTRETSGATKIKLENCMAGELQELHIYGNNTVFERVFPSKKLYPSKSLYPRGFGKIAIYNDISEEIILQDFNGYASAIRNPSDNTIGFTTIKDASNKRPLYFVKINPNTDYKISLNINELIENENFCVGLYSKEFEEKIIDENNNNYYYANNYYGNVFYDTEKNEFVIDASITTLNFKSGAEDEYLVIRCNSNRIAKMSISANYQLIELTELKSGLRQYEDVCDELVLKNNKLQVIRRIGVDSDNNKYILENEIIEDLRDLTVILGKGTNYVEILNYVANMSAKYIVINDFTSHFVSTVEMKTTIAQVADSIGLTLNKKIGKDELIAAFNMAVIKAAGGEISEEEVEKTLIQIFANLLEIKTDNFQLDKDGTTTIIKGIIAGLTMVRESNRSKLFKKIDDYESGLWIPDTDPTVPFLFAGYDSSKGGSIFNSNAYITHSGHMFAKWFEVNGESGCFYVKYDSGKVAMMLTKDYIHRYLSNGNRWTSEGIGLIDGGPTAHTIWLYDAQFYSIESGVHGEWYFRIYRRGNNNEAPSADFNCNLFVNGYQVGTSASDKRLKKNRKKCTKSGLATIKKYKIESFDWKDTDEHVDFGIMAQDAQKVDSSSVIYSEKYDTWQMNPLVLINTVIKAVQELSEENEKLKKQVDMQKKQIDFLISKLGCKEELDNFMKGEEDD